MTIEKEWVSHINYYVFEYLQNRKINFVSKDEIVQNVLIKVWKNLHRIDSSRSIKPWLKTICHNQTKNHIRNFCAQNKRENHWSIDRLLETDTLPLLFSSDNQETLEGELVRKLSSKEFLVYCCLMQGEDTKTIAGKINAPIQTVHGAKRRIRKKYKSLL